MVDPLMVAGGLALAAACFAGALAGALKGQQSVEHDDEGHAWWWGRKTCPVCHAVAEAAAEEEPADPPARGEVQLRSGDHVHLDLRLAGSAERVELEAQQRAWHQRLEFLRLQGASYRALCPDCGLTAIECAADARGCFGRHKG